MRLLAAVVLLCSPALAQRHFAFSEQAALEGRSLELSSTPRLGRAQPYVRLDQRAGVRLFTNDWLQGDAALAFSTEAKGLYARESLEAWASTRWKLSRGWLGAMVEAQANLTGAAFEANLLASRIAERWAVAANVGALAAMGSDTRLELLQTGAASLRVTDSFSTGLELTSRSAYRDGVFEGWALSAGPTASYQQSGTYLVVSFLPQLLALKPAADRALAEPLALRAHERFVARILLGRRL